MRPLLILLALLSAPAHAAVRLYVFDCGTIVFDDIAHFELSNDDTDVRKLFVPCYLVEHRADRQPVQRLLFDAGLAPGLAGQGPVESEPGMTLEYQRPLADQLADLELTPADIDYVAFSHLHFDHVGSANLFSESVQLIQAAEYQAGYVDRLPVYQPELYLGLADTPRKVLDGDFDVFGDDSVRLVSAPGHTPGHQALLVRLRDTGPVVLSGDLYHFRATRRLRRVPVFNTDREQTLASMAKVEVLLEAEGATLWIEHDQALADTLDKAPRYYE